MMETFDPVAATLLSMIFLGVSVNSWECIGGALILGAVAFLAVPSKHPFLIHYSRKARASFSQTDKDQATIFLTRVAFVYNVDDCTEVEQGVNESLSRSWTPNIWSQRQLEECDSETFQKKILATPLDSSSNPWKNVVLKPQSSSSTPRTGVSIVIET